MSTAFLSSFIMLKLIYNGGLAVPTCSTLFISYIAVCMLNNPKQRKYLREIKKQENVKAHDRHSILTKLLPDNDAQFPPLLKLASK